MKTLVKSTIIIMVLVALTKCQIKTAENNDDGGETEHIYVPEIDGEWWQLTNTFPDISPYEYTKRDNNVCDFTIFQAGDGTWQCIACIRGNTYPGFNRVFFRWQANNLTDTLWQEKGVFQSTGTSPEKEDPFGNILDTSLYKAVGIMQAPHFIKHNGKYYFFYSNRNAMCKISDDGLNWQDLKNDEGEYEFFEMGRDLMIFDDTQHSGKWITYYTTGSNFPQFVAARQSDKLTGTWSDEKMVYDGWSNTRSPIYPNEFAESPFVVRYQDKYYLFSQLHVFISDDPMDFTANKKVAVLESCNYRERVWAPELVIHNDEYYLAAYRTSGLWMAKLKWKEKEQL